MITRHLMILAGLGLLPATTIGSAQKRGGRPAVPDQDPYTRGEPIALSRAGYVSFGPFEWGGGTDTRDIEEGLGDIGLRWVETDHFRIGSSLGAWTIPAKDTNARKRLRVELTRLRKKLPRIKKPTRIRKLDPWLRLHLFAMRMEALYDEFTKQLGNPRWRRAASSPIRKVRMRPKAPIGEGPYLGMPAKFTLLMFQRPTSLERYHTLFLGQPQRYPRRHVFGDVGSALFVTAANVSGGSYVHDTALHSHVVFGVTHNLVECYLGNFYPLPVWWSEGVAHWFSRRVSTEFCNYTQSKDFPQDVTHFTNWRHFVRRLVQRNEFRPAPEMLSWLDFEEFTFQDHLVAWSRVDFLMRRGKGFGVFMDVVKGLRDPNGRPPTGEQILAAQKAALGKAWRLDPSSFDHAWTQFVLRNYASPPKR